MTTPGVGALTALTFAAAIDDAGRFSSSRMVGAQFGLTSQSACKRDPSCAALSY
jgi:transposase